MKYQIPSSAWRSKRSGLGTFTLQMNDNSVAHDKLC
jgi:hypothetical protein